MANGGEITIQSEDSGTTCDTRLQEDDTTDLHIGGMQPDSGNTTSYGAISGNVVRTLSAASHDFDIDFAASADGKTVHIRRARIHAMELGN